MWKTPSSTSSSNSSANSPSCFLILKWPNNKGMDYTGLPKIELHLHLDCSLSYAVVQRINPSIRAEEYRRSFIAPAKCTDLADYISRAVRGVELMQTKEQLRL